jgi:hypothetical protein
VAMEQMRRPRMWAPSASPRSSCFPFDRDQRPAECPSDIEELIADAVPLLLIENHTGAAMRVPHPPTGRPIRYPDAFKVGKPSEGSHQVEGTHFALCILGSLVTHTGIRASEALKYS